MVTSNSQSVSTTSRLAAKARDDSAWLRLDSTFRPIVLSWFRRGWHLSQATADSTKTIFERVIVNGECASEVAADLGMNKSAVRETKRSVLKSLRDEWAHLFGEWPLTHVVARLP